MQDHLSRPVESHGIRGDLAAEFDQMPTIQKGSKDGTDKTRRKRQSPSPDSPPSRRPGDGSPSDDGKATGRRKLRPRIRPPRKESDANFVPDDAQADDDEGIISDVDDDIDVSSPSAPGTHNSLSIMILTHNDAGSPQALKDAHR